MKDKIFETITVQKMLKQGDSVIVGLSGGADSVALLCVLSELRHSLGINIYACHVNHNLRGEESERDVRFCQQLCRDMDIALTVKSVNVAEYCKINRCSVEEGARILRYDALCGIDPQAKVATAHTLSDNAETLLINLIRGAALEGLCGIPPVRENIIRPMLLCTRDEVESYLSGIGQGYITDSTNLTEDYTRNHIRHALIPLLKEMNPAFEQAVGRTTQALNEDRRLIAQLTQQALRNAQLHVQQKLPEWASRLQKYLPVKYSWSRALLVEQPQSIRMRCYKEILLKLGQRYDTQRLRLIDEHALLAQGAIQLNSSNTLYFNEQMLWVEKAIQPPDIKPQTFSLVTEGNSQRFSVYHDVTLNILEIQETEIKFFVNNPTFQFKNAIDCDRIEKILTIRSRQPGEKILLAGRNQTQTVKNLLNAHSIPPILRDSLIVLSDSQGPIWLEGFGVCERAAISHKTRRAALITIREE